MTEFAAALRDLSRPWTWLLIGLAAGIAAFLLSFIFPGFRNPVVLFLAPAVAVLAPLVIETNSGRARLVGLGVLGFGAAAMALVFVAYAWPASGAHGHDRSLFEILAAKITRRTEVLAIGGTALLILGGSLWSVPTVQKIARRQPSTRWALVVIGLGTGLSTAGLVNLIVPERAFPSGMSCVVDYDVIACNVMPWPAASPATALGLAAIVIGAWRAMASVGFRHIVWAFVSVAIVVPLLLLAAATYHPPLNQFCDGGYPEWTGDPCGDRWTNPSLLDYFWPPEHWHAPTVGGWTNVLRP